jgi:hypothetical protein
MRPFSPTRSQPQVIGRQEPKPPMPSICFVVSASMSLAAKSRSHRCQPLATDRRPLHLLELHFGFAMLLDVRANAIRLWSQPLMSSSSVEPQWAPQLATSDPELVCRHLPGLTTGSAPPNEPTNNADDH